VPAARAARTSSISAAKVASSGIACPSQRRICSLTRGSAAASSVSTKLLASSAAIGPRKVSSRNSSSGAVSSAAFVYLARSARAS